MIKTNVTCKETSSSMWNFQWRRQAKTGDTMAEHKTENQSRKPLYEIILKPWVFLESWGRFLWWMLPQKIMQWIWHDSTSWNLNCERSLEPSHDASEKWFFGPWFFSQRLAIWPDGSFRLCGADTSSSKGLNVNDDVYWTQLFREENIMTLEQSMAGPWSRVRGPPNLLTDRQWGFTKVMNSSDPVWLQNERAASRLILTTRGPTQRYICRARQDTRNYQNTYHFFRSRLRHILSITINPGKISNI